MLPGSRFGAIALVVLTAVGCDRPAEKPASAPPATTAPAAAAAPDAKGTGEAVATFSGRTITSDQVMKELERLPAPSRAYLAAPERKRQFIENLVMNDLLYAEGQKGGLDKDPEIEKQVNDLRKRLVVQRGVRQYQN